MSDVTPTRSAVIEMKDERRAMQEGYVFLDEKCLLLAGEMLRELERHARLQRDFLTLHDAARRRAAGRGGAPRPARPAGLSADRPGGGAAAHRARAR